MPSSRKNFEQVVRDTAQRKTRVAEVRFNGTANSVEVPRAVYLAVCQQIADVLKSDGFSYGRSAQKLTRKTGDFAFQIFFQSSHHNISGELVVLWIHGQVLSPTLKKWRDLHQSLISDSDGLAGGQIGNLLHPASWMEWNLATPASRETEVVDAIGAIRRIAYPYFGMFDNIPHLIERLLLEDIPSFSPTGMLDFIMCFGTPTTARQAAINFLNRHPASRQDYHRALDQFRKDGLPKWYPSKHSEVIARASIIYPFADISDELGLGEIRDLE